jgi:RNA polymerase-binding transcription factor DksA
MSPDQYRAKAEDLKAKSRGEDSAINRAVFEGLAQSYHRLAHLEEKHQFEIRQKAQDRSLSKTGWYCECGHSISSFERETYFTTRLCMRCNREANERLSRLYDLASSDSDFTGRSTKDSFEQSHWMLVASKFLSPLLGKMPTNNRTSRS